MIAKGRKLTRILAEAGWRHVLLRQRVAAGVEHAGVLRQLGTVRTLVDIGANRGQFALAARHCFPAAKIYSFEPLAGPAGIFRRVFSVDARVILYESAIGPKAGQAEIHISARDDSSSLLPITEWQSALFPGTAEVACQAIQMTPLDAVLASKDIEEPALLKLDVQGFELQALQGCESLLEHFDWIYAECSFVELYKGQALADEVIAWLRERGFMLSGIYNMSNDSKGRAIQADFLFDRRREAG